MSFWRLYYHVVWTTRQRAPLILPEVEPELYGYFTGKTASLEAILHAIGGTDDHVHLAVSVPPKLAVATFVGLLKGSSAFHLNHLPGAEGTFAWQDEYGVLSFSERALPEVTAYIRDQRERHLKRDLWMGLERTQEEQARPSMAASTFRHRLLSHKWPKLKAKAGQGRLGWSARL